MYVNSVNPLYLRINNASGYIKEINKDKYLIFDDTDENKELLKIYDNVFSGIMSKINGMMIGLNIQRALKKLSSIQMIIYH